jgi:hypothetical protein
MQTACAEHSAELPMPTPHEVLAEEIGRFAAGLRRELREARELAFAEMRAELATVRQQIAEFRLAYGELELRARERLAEVRDGRDGADGKDGRDGADGGNGEPGPPGRDGLDGKDGSPGRDGRDGVDGAPGRDGVDGAPGADGRDGSDGADGRDGAPGKDGEPGLQGPAGKLSVAREWTRGVHYEGAIVTSGGSLWQASRDTGEPPGHDDWTLLAAKGRDATEVEHLGTYDPDASYGRNCIVALDGGAFMALRDDPGPCPGDGWRLLVARGKSGKPGDRGPMGERGPVGPPGPEITKLALDGFSLVLVQSNGKTVTCNVRQMFEDYHRMRGDAS